MTHHLSHKLPFTPPHSHRLQEMEATEHARDTEPETGMRLDAPAHFPHNGRNKHCAEILLRLRNSRLKRRRGVGISPILTPCGARNLLLSQEGRLTCLTPTHPWMHALIHSCWLRRSSWFWRNGPKLDLLTWQQ